MLLSSRLVPIELGGLDEMFNLLLINSGSVNIGHKIDL